MIRTIAKNWWLLALCGVLEAAFSAILLVQKVDGTLGSRHYALPSTVHFLGKLALAAGVCTMAAGIWRSAKGKCWLLVVNGLALLALGLVMSGLFGPRIQYRTIADLVMAAAISIAILQTVTARTFRRSLPDLWFLGLAAAGSLGYALLFLAAKPAPGAHADFIWFGSYFAFSAICMLALALRLHGTGGAPLRLNLAH